MSLRSSLGLLVLTLLVPTMALAAPENVTGITATMEGQNVRVTWQQVSGAIASYRIFYSSASILQNGGLFDDFETVDGSVNTHLLRNIPAASALTVSVLAVDAQGEESPFFVEEATVALSTSSRPSLAPTPTLAPPSDDSPTALRLLTVESVSPTTVLLTFSHPVSIPQDRALETVVIETSDGTRLRLNRVTASGTMLVVETSQQTPGTIYRTQLGNGITGTGDDGRIIALAPDLIPMLFAGIAAALPPTPSSAPVAAPDLPPSPAAGPDVTGLALRAQLENGLYTVEATWRAPNQPITGYELLQTTDNGRTFGAVTSVPPTTTGVRIPSIPPGTFGVFVRAVLQDGTRTNGLTQVIDLPGTVLSPTPLVGQVQPPVQQSGSTALPGSGPGLWLLMTLAGAMVGVITLRQRRRLVAEGA
jgi:hypothetical protein